MIRSMTGFGSAATGFRQKNISVEIKSVNSKFFDLTLRLPPSYREKEMEIRTELARAMERGKAEVTFSIETQEVMKKATINTSLFKAYFQELRKLDSELEYQSSNLTQIILSMPEVLVNEKTVLDQEEWLCASKTLNEALRKFDQFRSAEGKTVENDLAERINAILTGINTLASFEKGRIEIVRQRLQSGLEEFIQINNIDRNRLEQELIFYIEKLDISEEKVRLKSHCDYFLQTIKEDSSGKKLSFISQEIGREINTIGSKANDAEMQKQVVILKDELEKIKEQLMNIL